MDNKRLNHSIPEKILLQILLQLPVESLLRCRAVSKRCRTIIDDPSFVESHHIRSHTRPGGIRLISEHIKHRSNLVCYFKLHSVDPEGDSPMPFLICDRIPGMPSVKDQMYYYDSVQTVHGLVHKDGTVYNPSTRESIALPSLDISMEVDIRVFAENKYKIVPQYFLGFDSITNAFKVLNLSSIILPKCVPRTELRVLTLGNDSWKIIDVMNQFGNLGIRRSMGICIDGVIFCSAYTYECDDIVDDFILAFEVGAEKFRRIPVPGDYMQMVNVGNRLALVDSEFIRDPEEEEVMTIWILENYENLVWKKMERFRSPAMEIFTRNKMSGVSIKETCSEAMGTIHTNEVLFFAKGYTKGDIREECAWCCFYYDLDTNNFRLVPTLTEIPEECRDTHSKQSYIKFTKYVESLFSLTKLLPA